MLDKTKCVTIWHSEHSCHSASKRAFGFCPISCFLLPDCSVPKLQTLHLSWNMWKRHSISNVTSGQTCFCKCSVALGHLTWSLSIDISETKEFSKPLYNTAQFIKFGDYVGLWAKVTDRHKENLSESVSGLWLLPRNLVCSISDLEILGSHYFFLYWNIINIFHKYLYIFFKTSLNYTHKHTHTYILIKILSWRFLLFFILSATHGKTTLFGLIVILEVKHRLLPVFQFKLFIHFPIIALQKPQRYALKF